MADFNLHKDSSGYAMYSFCKSERLYPDAHEYQVPSVFSLLYIFLHFNEMRKISFVATTQNPNQIEFTYYCIVFVN